tara:strand:- start:175 stop:552 length:378 start_codon:yes stop_codon:yes gene_type:complete
METWENVENKALQVNPRSVGKSVKINYQIITIAFNKLEKVIDEKTKLTASSVSVFVMMAFNIVNEILMATDKKYKIELVLIIMRKLIDKVIKNKDEVVLLNTVLDTTVPALINSMGLKPKYFCCW